MRQPSWVILENATRNANVEALNDLLFECLKLVIPNAEEITKRHKKIATIKKSTGRNKKGELIKQVVPVSPLANFLLTLIAFKSNQISLEFYNKKMRENSLLKEYSPAMDVLDEYNASLLIGGKKEIYYTDDRPEWTKYDVKQTTHQEETSEEISPVSTSTIDSTPAASLTFDELIDICGNFPHILLQKIFSLCDKDFFTKERIKLLSEMRNTVAYGLSVYGEELFCKIINQIVDISSLETLDAFLRLPRLTFSQIYAIAFKFNDPEAPNGRGDRRLTPAEYSSEKFLAWLETFKGISHLGMLILHNIENYTLPLSKDSVEIIKSLSKLDSEDYEKKKSMKASESRQAKLTQYLKLINDLFIAKSNYATNPAESMILSKTSFAKISELLKASELTAASWEKAFGSGIREIEREGSDVRFCGDKLESIKRSLENQSESCKKEIENTKRTLLRLEGEIPEKKNKLSDLTAGIPEKAKEAIIKYTTNTEISFIEQELVCRRLGLPFDMELQQETFVEEFCRWFKVLIEKNDYSWEKTLQQICSMDKDCYQITPAKIAKIKEHLNKFPESCKEYADNIRSTFESCFNLIADIRSLQKELDSLNKVSLETKQKELQERLQELLNLISSIEFNKNSFFDSGSDITLQESIESFIKALKPSRPIITIDESQSEFADDSLPDIIDDVVMEEFEQKLLLCQDQIDRNELNEDIESYSFPIKMDIMINLLMEACRQCGLPFEAYRHFIYEYLDSASFWEEKSSEQVINAVIEKITLEKKTIFSLERMALLASQPNSEQLKSYICKLDQYEIDLSPSSSVAPDRMYIYPTIGGLICVIKDSNNMDESNTVATKCCIIPWNELPDLSKREADILKEDEDNVYLKAILKITSEKKLTKVSDQECRIFPIIQGVTVDGKSTIRLLGQPMIPQTIYALSTDNGLLCFVTNSKNQIEPVLIPSDRSSIDENYPEQCMHIIFQLMEKIDYIPHVTANPHAKILWKYLCTCFREGEDLPLWDKELADTIIKLHTHIENHFPYKKDVTVFTGSKATPEDEKASNDKLVYRYIEFILKNNKTTINDEFDLFKMALINVTKQVINNPPRNFTECQKDDYLAKKIITEMNGLRAQRKATSSTEQPAFYTGGAATHSPLTFGSATPTTSQGTKKEGFEATPNTLNK